MGVRRRMGNIHNHSFGSKAVYLNMLSYYMYTLDRSLQTNKTKQNRTKRAPTSVTIYGIPPVLTLSSLCW